MPNLPEQQAERDFELADVTRLDRGELGNPKPVIRKYHKPFPKLLVGSLLILVILLAAIYAGTSYFFPNYLKSKLNTTTVVKHFEYPVNAADIKFPGSEVKKEFMTNLQSAASEQDTQKRYQFLENAFVQLRGFYTLGSDPSYRIHLDTYKDYMQKNYPDQFANNSALYNYSCLDKECGQVKDPDVILEVRNSIFGNAVLDKLTQETIIRDFDAAALNTDKDFVGNMYNAALTLISSEVIRTNDVQLVADQAKLKVFMKVNYPEIPIVESTVK